MTSSEKERNNIPRKKTTLTKLKETKEITLLSTNKLSLALLLGHPTGNNAFNFAHFCTFVLIFAHSPTVELDCAPTLKTTGVCYAAMA